MEALWRPVLGSLIGAFVFDSSLLGAVTGLVVGFWAVKAWNLLEAFINSVFRLVSGRSVATASLIALGIIVSCVLGSSVLTFFLCHSSSLVCGRGTPRPPFGSVPSNEERHGDHEKLQLIMSNTIIVTAAGSEEFEALRNLVGSIQFWHPDLSILIWDTGLNEKQMQEASCWANVELRVLPFESYPAHISKIETFAFKSLAMEVTLQHHLNALWIDCQAEVRSSLEPIIRNLHRNGYWFASHGGKVVAVSHPETMSRLQVSSLDLGDKIACSGLAFGFVRDSEAYHDVLLPAIECSVDPRCIDPKSLKEFALDPVRHNFDVAVFSILLHKNDLGCDSSRDLVEFNLGKLTLDETTYNSVVLAVYRGHRGQAYIKHLQTGKCLSEPQLAQLLMQKSRQTIIGTVSQGKSHGWMQQIFISEATRLFSSWLFWGLSIVSCALALNGLRTAWAQRTEVLHRDDV
jgi:hypothetical protein